MTTQQASDADSRASVGCQRLQQLTGGRYVAGRGLQAAASTREQFVPGACGMQAHSVQTPVPTRLDNTRHPTTNNTSRKTNLPYYANML